VTVVVGAMPRRVWSNGPDEVLWSGVRDRPSQPDAAERERERPRTRSPDEHTGAVVRMLCFRLCDGYCWPMSFATTKGRLAQDARRCESSCSSPARLFFHSNPGEEADSMVDRDGNPYRQLPAACLYRSRNLAECTCRPQPWEEDAAARYRVFADAADGKTTQSDKSGRRK
jgi:hypothetical protein